MVPVGIRGDDGESLSVGGAACSSSIGPSSELSTFAT